MDGVAVVTGDCVGVCMMRGGVAISCGGGDAVDAAVGGVVVSGVLLFRFLSRHLEKRDPNLR